VRPLRLHTKCVLIADDSPVVRRSLHQLFEQEGWDVCAEASDGQEAITKALALKPTIIVLDFAMAGMNGLSAARILKAAIPEAQLILFSGLASLLSAEELRRSGVSAVVSKGEPGALISEAQDLVDAA
jgi:DNA-binding NarL/FixJ family response regulator